MEASKEGRYYVVKKGDSLWGIAKHFGYNVEQLAAYNDLTGKQKRLIHVGQKIHLPDGKAGPDLKLSVKLVGLSNKPIKNAKLKVAHDGKEIELKTDSSGWLHGLDIQDHLKGLKIEFENYQCKWQKILDEEILPLGEKILQINILTDLIRGRTFRKDGPALVPDKQTGAEVKKDTPQPRAEPSHKKDLQNIAAQPVVKETRTSNGVPTTINAPLFASENLYLNKGNEKFRQALIETAKRYGFTPHSLAAIINAEAAKTKDGTWIEDSAAEGSSARGLGQFLPAAWYEYVAKEGTLGNPEALKKIGATKLRAKNGTLYKIDGKDATEVSRSTRNIILEWRNNGIYSIDAIASNAEDSLKYLSNNGISTSALPPDEKAKISYVMHHEGRKGGLLYLQGKFGKTPESSVDDAKTKLAKQLRTKSDNGTARAKRLADLFGGDYVKAYYYFLANHTDAKVRVKNFMLKSEGFQERSGYEVIESVAGISISRPSSGALSQNPSNEKSSDSSKPTEVMPEASVGGVPSWHDPLKGCVIRIGGYRDSESSPDSARKKSLFDGGGRAKRHTGIDLAAASGTPVFAVANGEVLHADLGGTYGNVILLKVNINDLPPQQKKYAESIPGIVNNSIYFMYAHLSEMAVKVISKKVCPVHAGQVIGKTGDTGNAKGMTDEGPYSTIKHGGHLHFEVRRSDNLAKGQGKWFDPKPFLVKCD
ncbi:MAG TPA: LysM peptidoglycan-binding domain-containing M23 family metallopeptidase [Noviherbaspirillum sp.]|nr:LysM peptidoglycan-binding domain-containing M23 family metallopeptidase [Noviherbaspirillum sp.]